MNGTFQTSITGWKCGNSTERTDLVVQEAPLDIRVLSSEVGAIEQRLAVTLRTPGDDVELVFGYLFSEGVIISARDCLIDQKKENLVAVRLKPWVVYSERQLARSSYIHSGCGLCGKTFIDAVHTIRHRQHSIKPVVFHFGWLETFSQKMKNKQELFVTTGGSHAAALFDTDGNLLQLAEDVGRHNALDKVIGKALIAGQLTHDRVLWISGRAGFELVQKAVMAGVGMLVAVGAPSSLGVEIAEEFNLTLVAFACDGKANVYHQG